MTGAQQPAALLLAEEVWGSPLHAIRSLDAAGADVLVATAGSGAHIFGRSRCRPQVADFDPTGGERFLADALDWARRHTGEGPFVVIPFSDRLTETMHRHRDLLGPPALPVLSSPASLDELLDKSSSMRAAARAGLQVPPWTTLQHRDDLSLLGDLEAPLVLKPASWVSSDGAGFKISVHERTDDARRIAARALGRGVTLIVQEYRREPVEHIELAITWRSADGTSTAICTGRKRRQSGPEGGVMAWGESLELSDVAAAATAFLDATGFTGPGGIELIRTHRGLEFIEFNPRIEAIHFLASAAGVDVVRLAYDDVGLDRRPRVPPRQHAAAAWIGTAWIERLLERPGDWKLLLQDRFEFAKAPTRERAVLTWRDPGPAAVLSVGLTRAGIRRVTGGRKAP